MFVGVRHTGALLGEGITFCAAAWKGSLRSAWSEKRWRDSSRRRTRQKLRPGSGKRWTRRWRRSGATHGGNFVSLGRSDVCIYTRFKVFTRAWGRGDGVGNGWSTVFFPSSSCSVTTIRYHECTWAPLVAASRVGATDERRRVQTG